MTTVDFFNLLSDCDPKKSLIYKIEDDEYTIEAIHRINGKVLVFGFNNPYGNNYILDVSCLEQFLFNSDELPLYLVTIKEGTPSQIDTVVGLSENASILLNTKMELRTDEKSYHEFIEMPRDESRFTEYGKARSALEDTTI